MSFLDDDRIGRVVLVEVSYHDGTGVKTAYFSNKGYTTSPTDDPPNTSYDDLLESIPVIQSSVDRGFSVGSFRFNSSEDEYSSWWEYSFQGWPVRIRIGPEGEPLSQFMTLVEGVNDGITFPSKSIGQISFRNKALILDTEIQNKTIEQRVSEISPSSILLDDIGEEPCPISLGKVFNVPARRIASNNLIYLVHDNSDVTVTAVRDNGVPVTFTDNNNGSFTLSQNPQGVITADVINGNGTTTEDVVKELVNIVDPSATFLQSTFDTYPEYDVGVHIPSGGTAREFVDQVVHSSFGFWYYDRLGRFAVGQVVAPETVNEQDVVMSLGIDDIDYDGISITQYQSPVSKVRIGYQKNYTVQGEDGLAGSVITGTPSLADRYSKEYNEVVYDNDILVQWPYAETTDLLGTLLYERGDAESIAEHVAQLQNKARIQLKIKGISRPLSLQLGDVVMVTHPKWGLQDGRKAIVVGLNENPTRNRVEIEVWL